MPIIGTNGNDTLYGTSASEEINGLDGNDLIILDQSISGIDTINGGTGIDTIDFSGQSVEIIVNLDQSPYGITNYFDHIYDVENVTGTAFDDKVLGSAAANLISGGDGADDLDGNGGDDTLLGGDGDDLLTGNNGNDILSGGGGTDTAYYLGKSADFDISITGGTITITDLVGTEGIDTLTGIEYLKFADKTIAVSSLLVPPDAVNDGPISVYTGGLNTIAAATLLANDSDANGDALSITAVGSASNGTVTLDGNGDVIFTAKAGYTGSASFTYTISDGNGGFDTATVTLTVGRNPIDGTGSGETITGTTFDDHIRGFAGNDTINALDGDDLIEGGAGADTINGGAGIDYVSYAASSTGVKVNLATNSNTLGDAAGDMLYNVEGLVGSAYNDTLTGDANDNFFIYSGGIDTIEAGSGFDQADFSTVVLPSSFTMMRFNDNGYFYFQNEYTNTTSNQGKVGGIEWLRGSDWRDYFSGPGSLNTVRTYEGGGGADIFDGNYASVTLLYTSSNAGVSVNLTTGAASGGHAQGDVFLGTTIDPMNGKAVTLEGATHLGGSAHADTLIGNAEDNKLWGLDGSDAIDGADGNDTIYAGAGADTVSGGAGHDILDYSTSTVAMQINLGSNVHTGGEADGDNISGIEEVVAGSGNDTLAGDDKNNVLEGGAGADTINGGAGIDLVSYLGSSAAVNINLATGSYSGGHAAGDSYANIEGVIGSALNDTLTGDGSDNVLEGAGGADTISGGGGTDYASYSKSAVAVNVNLTTGSHSGGDAVGDVLSGIEGLIGSAFNDTLTGDGGNNFFRYSGGRDTFNGAGGFDTIDFSDVALSADHTMMRIYDNGYFYFENEITNTTSNQGGIANIESIRGSEWRDYIYGPISVGITRTYEGGGGADIFDTNYGIVTLAYTSSDASVSVNLATGAASGGHAEGDQFLGNILDPRTGKAATLEGATHLSGSKFADLLWGDSKANNLFGYDGDDTIEGGVGSDTINGGAGIDLVSYSGSTTGVTINLATNSHSGGDAAGDTISNIEGVIGSAHADTITGNTGDNFLAGGISNDILTGGNGSDIYFFNRADGLDQVLQASISDAATTTDEIRFGSGIDHDQLWFRQSGNDLLINVIGEVASQVTVKNWYSDTSRQVDKISVAGGTESLLAADVQALVTAMASWSVPPAGQTELTTAQHTALDTLLAASWN